MSVPSVVDANAAEQIFKVAELHVKGNKPMAISKNLGIPFAQVKQSIEAWQNMLTNDLESRDAARDYLNQMVSHYDDLIKKSHDNLENLATLGYDEKVSAQINATIKNIADLEAKRVDALQKAGLLDGADLGDELAERERREEIILGILRDDLCGNCKVMVRDKLSALSGVVEGTVVED